MLLNPECCSFSWLHTCTHCHRSLLQKKKCYPIAHFTTGNVEVKMLSGPGWHLWVKMHIQMQADFHSRDVRHNDTYKQTPKHCSEQAFFSLFFCLFGLLLDTAYQLVSEEEISLRDFSNMKREKKVLGFYHPLEKKCWNFTPIICTIRTNSMEELDTLRSSLWVLCHLLGKSVSHCFVLSIGWIYLIASCFYNRQTDYWKLSVKALFLT